MSIAQKFEVAWFKTLTIVASNDINEDTILSLNDQARTRSFYKAIFGRLFLFSSGKIFLFTFYTNLVCAFLPSTYLLYSSTCTTDESSEPHATSSCSSEEGSGLPPHLPNLLCKPSIPNANTSKNVFPPPPPLGLPMESTRATPSTASASAPTWSPASASPPSAASTSSSRSTGCPRSSSAR